MQRRIFLRRVASSLTVLSLPQWVGCGSVLHPERVGQPRSGPLDWKIVALDGIGLLLFVVPGVVAFAVDFYNGAIFLPPDHFVPAPVARTPPPYVPPASPPPGVPYAPAAVPAPAGMPAPGAWGRTEMRRVPVNPEELTPDGIAHVVSQHMGQPVTLDDATRVAPLDSLDQFRDQAGRLAENGSASLPFQSVFPVGEDPQ